MIDKVPVRRGEKGITLGRSNTKFYYLQIKVRGSRTIPAVVSPISMKASSYQPCHPLCYGQQAEWKQSPGTHLASPGIPHPLRRFVLIVIWGEDTNLFSTAPSARAAAIAPTIPAASIAPNDTNTAATNAPNTFLQSAPTMNCWQQLIVKKSRTNNPDNDITNPRQASLSAELRALALQRKSIDARLNDRQTPGNEGGHGGPDPIPPDEVRRLRKKRGKITARERKLLNRLRDIRAGASQRDAQTDAGAAVRDQRQVREEETQREKPLTAPEPTAPADRNRADSDGERPRRQKRRGKWAGQTHREFLATNTLPPRTSEPQPGPSGLGAMKTSRPDETASPSALQGEPKRVRVQSSQGDQKTYAQATKDILARLAVAICFTPPAQDMTPNQGERVQAEIERLIMEKRLVHHIASLQRVSSNGGWHGTYVV
ncbi:hypothetical protein ACJJTC_017324 [Scirpophaga incertulas]